MPSDPTILNTNLPPLAQRMRPQTLSDYRGQPDLIHKGSLLSSSIEKNQPFSMILYGPPGTGKTTLAKILSRKFKAIYYELSAVSSGVAKVREILKKSEHDSTTVPFLLLEQLTPCSDLDLQHAGNALLA
ncbi:MAG: AAA family ATPase, partial [Rhodobiaceae bacterium]|nr:AAA family ATPase [Rhodobiaceae bacterium]